MSWCLASRTTTAISVAACSIRLRPSPRTSRSTKGIEAPIANGQATCTFANVPPGTYAVAYYKAAPGQTKMNTGMFGSAADPYGFSRNATIGMGPPSFNSAASSYAGGNTAWPVTITYP